MADPSAGVSEMVRVTRPGGVVAPRVWDFAGGLCRASMPVGPFTVSATAWTARGVVAG